MLERLPPNGANDPMSRILLAAVFCIVTLACLAGCATQPRSDADPAAIPSHGQSIPDHVETAMPTDSVIKAHTAAGRLTIEAGPDSLRVFAWQGARRGAVTKPRSEAFAGAAAPGLYYADEQPAWPAYKGIDKLRYEEGVRDFDNASDMRTWLKIRRMYFSYDNTGLAVGWKRDGDTLHVEVWQFTVAGATPETLPGADDDAVVLLSADE